MGKSMKSLIKCFIGCFLFVGASFTACTNEDSPIVDKSVIVSVGEKQGVEAYWTLYNAHVEALKTGKNVGYTGEDIVITIPEDAEQIPLTNNTDFNGSTITVDNKTKDGFFLFTLMNEAKPIEVSQNLLGGGATLARLLSLVKERYYCYCGMR